MQVIKVKKVPTVKTLTPVQLVPSPSPPPLNPLPIKAKRLVQLVPLEPVDPPLHSEHSFTNPSHPSFPAQSFANESYPPSLPVSPVSRTADFDDISISSDSDISEVSAKPTFDKRFTKADNQSPLKEPINKSIKEPIKSEPKSRLNEIRQVEEKSKKEGRRSAASLMGNGLGKAQTACTPLNKISTSMCPLGLFLSLVLPLVALGLLIPFLMSAPKCMKISCNATMFEYYDEPSMSCKQQTLYNTTCGNDFHCRIDRGLVCGAGKCDCRFHKQFWHTELEKCINLYTYTNQTCTDDKQCDGNLICNLTPSDNNCSCPEPSIKGMCDCKREKGTNENYWNGATCLPAEDEFSDCSINSGCLSPMFCDLKHMCVCEDLFYFNKSLSECMPQKNHSEFCKYPHHCRADLGLKCIDGVCECFEENQFWYEPGKICRTILKYTEKTCTEDWQCASNLICNLQSKNNTCACPEQSQFGMCDCWKLKGNETYWNGTACVPAHDEYQSCIADYNCLYPMKCMNDKCTCKEHHYFNKNESTCVPQGLYNATCEIDHHCKGAVGLYCKDGFCKCLSEPTKFWYVYESIKTCRNLLNYSDTFCTDDSQCGSNLICRVKGLNSVCSCNKLSVDNMCDCIKVKGNETYWSGSSCVPAKNETEPCTARYECLNPMLCTSNKCSCLTFFYFDSASSSCLPQNTINQTCSVQNHCRSDQALYCDTKTGFCKCNVTQFWDISAKKCRDYLKYNETTCTSSAQCSSNLICNIPGLNSTCNCPSTTVKGMCDCIRIRGNETYWNGTHCVPAKDEGISCIEKYECLYPMSCLNKRCSCPPEQKFLKSSSRCAACTCRKEWNSYNNDKLKGFCFQLYKISKSEKDTNKLTICKGRGDDSSYIATENVFTVASHISDNTYYVGFHYHGVKNQSIPQTKCSNYNDGDDKKCSYYEKGCVESHTCDHDHDILCEMLCKYY